jgi:hypothetical protein
MLEKLDKYAEQFWVAILVDYPSLTALIGASCIITLIVYAVLRLL